MPSVDYGFPQPDPSRTPQQPWYDLSKLMQRLSGFGSSVFSSVDSANQAVSDAMNNAPFAFTDYARGVGQGFGNNVTGMYWLARHPVDSFVNISNGIGAMATHPMDAARTAIGQAYTSVANAFQSPESMGRFVGGMIQPGDVVSAALAEPAIREMVAYHGTPHTFSPTEDNTLGEFDSGKIGTGEGAVDSKLVGEFGHGVYVSGDQQYAAEYKNAFGLHGGKGNLYTADIPDNVVGRMLNWDEDIGKQTKNIRDIAKDFGVGGGEIGETLYSEISNKLGSDAAASDFLKAQGVPGHTWWQTIAPYHDGGSLQKRDVQNYVLYDPSIAKIINRE